MAMVRQPIDLGTIIIGAICENVIILGADSRVSVGSYILHSEFSKIIKLSRNIYAAFCGNCNITTELDIIKNNLKMYEYRTKKDSFVLNAANLISKFIYKNRGKLQGTCLVVAGWDYKEKLQLYMIHSNGFIERTSLAFAGSGSEIVEGFLHKRYNANMSRNECISLIKEVIELAICKDPLCGGNQSIVIVGDNSIDLTNTS